jgi:serine/threonine protein kinase/WD40 repeat protein
MNRNDPNLPQPDTVAAGVNESVPPQTDVPAPMTPTSPQIKVVTTKQPDGVAIRRQIGRYTVLKELGRGGMGVVYLAHQDDLNREVALKVITAGPDSDPTEIARFYHEAETSANLHHPNIVQVYEVGQADNVAYLAMEFIGGGNLYRRINKLPMPIREAAALLEPVARAVHYAHQHGVIHRDLKPSNILLVEPEPNSQINASDSRPIPGVNLPVPKIADFGLAKRLDKPMGLTGTGIAIGTPHYMAPEQARGDTAKIGPTTDVYALGTILYEMLIGYPPFNGANSLETMEYVVHRKPVAPSKLRQGIPSELETICLRALEKRTTDRFPDADAFADALKVFLTGEELSTVHGALPVVPNLRPPSRLVPMLLGALMISPIVAFLTWFIVHLWQPRHDTQAPDATAELKEELTRRMNAEKKARLALVQADFEQGRIQAGLTSLRVLLQEEAKLNLETPSEWQRQAETLLEAWQSYVLETAGVVKHPHVAFVTKVPLHDLFVTAGGNTVRFWNTVTHQQEGDDVLVGGKITALTVSDNGAYVAVGTDQRNALVFNPSNRQQVGKTIEWREGGGPSCLQFTADNKALMVGVEGGELHAFDVNEGTEIGQALGKDDGPWKLWSIHPKGFAISVNEEGKIRLWNHHSFPLVFAPPVSIGPLDDLQLSPDGRLWTGLTKQGAIKEYLRDENRCVDVPSSGQIATYAYSPDNNMILIGKSTGSIRLWDAISRTPLTEPITVNSGLVRVHFSQEGLVFAATEDGNVHTFRFGAMPYVSPTMWIENKPGKEILSLAFSPEGTRLYVTTPHSISRWNVFKGKRLSSDREYSAEKRIPAASKSPSEQTRFRAGGVVPQLNGQPEMMWVGSSSGHLYLIDSAKDASKLDTRLPDARDVTSVAVSREGNKTSACGRIGEKQGVVTYWANDTEEKKFERTHTYNYVVNHQVFSHNARELILGGADGNVRRLDVVNDVLIGEPLNCGSPVLCVAINETGNRILAGCADGTAHLWDVETNKELLILKHTVEVRAVAFTKDLLTAGADGALRRWDAKSGIALGPAWRHLDAITALAIRGDMIATGSRDRSIRVWRLP